MHINKTLFIDLISSDTGLSKKQSSNVLVVLLNTICAELAQGNSVQLKGFGKFYVEPRFIKKTKNSSTVLSVKTKPKSFAKFKASKVLLEKLNNLDFGDIEENNRIILQQLYELIENSEEYEETED